MERVFAMKDKQVLMVFISAPFLVQEVSKSTASIQWQAGDVLKEQA